MKHLIAGSVIGGLVCVAVNSAPVEWNGHYYEFVPGPGIPWTTAQSAVETSVYGGFRGHLVTVTAGAENAFVATLIDGVVSYPGDPNSDSVLEGWRGGCY